MKTWEVIKELTEHPEKMFQYNAPDGTQITLGVNGRFKEVVIEDKNEIKYLDWSFNCLLDNSEWTDVSSMNFIEAINSNKKIRSIYYPKFLPVNQWLYQLSNYETSVAQDYINGHWYIEQD